MAVIQESSVTLSLQQVIDLVVMLDRLPTFGQLVDVLLAMEIPIVLPSAPTVSSTTIATATNTTDTSSDSNSPLQGMDASSGKSVNVARGMSAGIETDSRFLDSEPDRRVRGCLRDLDYRCDSVSDGGLSYATPSPLNLPPPLHGVDLVRPGEDGSNSASISSPADRSSEAGNIFSPPGSSPYYRTPEVGSMGVLNLVYPPYSPSDSFIQHSSPLARVRPVADAVMTYSPGVGHRLRPPTPSNAVVSGVAPPSLPGDADCIFGETLKTNRSRLWSILEDADAEDLGRVKRQRVPLSTPPTEDQDTWYCVLHGAMVGVVCGR